MADRCPSLIKARVMRLTRLDACGKPVVGPKSVITTKGFISVAVTADLEDGQEFLVKNANGEICINEKDCSVLKRYNLATTMCQVDPSAVEMTTGQRLVTNGDGDAVGFAISEEFNCEAGYSLELWQKIAGGSCDAGDPEWFYWAWPFIEPGTLGDLTFENNPFQVQLNSTTKSIAADDQWGSGNQGPFAVLTPEQAMVAGEHVIGLITTVQPPEAVCGATAFGTPPVAAFTDTPTNLSVVFNSSGSTGTIVAYYWTFGDGHVSTASGPTHVYTNEGTYTVVLRVTDDNGLSDTVSHAVTVTAP